MVNGNLILVNHLFFGRLLMNTAELQQMDLHYNWHPCSQMKDYEQFEPLVIKRAYGSYLELADNSKIIDAISSWWCKSLGHNHPLLKKALLEQIEKFEHVIFANTTNDVIVKLSQKLARLMPGLTKVFYAGGDGSSAVEVALKMSLHSRIIQNETPRNKFIALKNGYHGETAGALSVSDLGLYRTPYAAMLFEPFFIEPVYVSGTTDPKWFDISAEWPAIEKELNLYSDSATAIILEPIVQASGNMKIYSQDFLTRINSWAKAHNIHIIADEIMTSIGRTGKMLACEHATIQPDFICLAKGLTAGWLPFSAVLTTEAIYQTFYDDYASGKSFMHSHTYSGNVLGACLANATLDIIETDNLCGRANELQTIMYAAMQDIAEKTGMLQNIRGIGAIVAADLAVPNDNQRYGFMLYQEAVKRGALLRPLGNTIYWLPPLTITEQTLMELKNITLQAITAVFPVKIADKFRKSVMPA